MFKRKNNEEPKYRKFWGDDVVSCDSCKCFLYKRDSHRGKSTIEGFPESEEEIGLFGAQFRWCYGEPEHIVEHFYCQKCKPRRKK